MSRPRCWWSCPTYNEVENLERDPGPAARQRARRRTRWSSTTARPDGTGELADKLAAADAAGARAAPDRQGGLGPAYVAGFRWAPRARLRRRRRDGRRRLARRRSSCRALLAALEDADLVLGSRYVPGGAVADWPAHRLLLSRAGQPLHPLGAAAAAQPTPPAATGPPAAELIDRAALRRRRQPGLLLPGRLGLAGGPRRAPGWSRCRSRSPNAAFGRSKMSGSIVGEALVRVTVWGLQDRLADWLPGRVARPVPARARDGGGRARPGRRAAAAPAGGGGRSSRDGTPSDAGCAWRSGCWPWPRSSSSSWSRPGSGSAGRSWRPWPPARSAGALLARQGTKALADLRERARTRRPAGPRARRRRAGRRRRAAHGAARLPRRPARAACLLPVTRGCCRGVLTPAGVARLPDATAAAGAGRAACAPRRWPADAAEPLVRRARPRRPWSSRARSSADPGRPAHLTMHLDVTPQTHEGPGARSHRGPCRRACREVLAQLARVRRPRSTSRRSASTSSRSSTERRSRSMSQCVRGGLTFLGAGSAPPTSLAAPNRRTCTPRCRGARRRRRRAP